MAGSIKPSFVNSNYRLIGVFSSVANFLSDINKTSATQGDVYYDTSLNELRVYDGTNWSAAGLNSQSAGSLNSGASIGSKITIDGTTVASQFEIEVSSGGLASGNVLLLDVDDTTNNPAVIDIDNDGTGVAIDINSAGTYDIQGTSDTWDISIGGAAHFTAVAVDDDEDIELGTATNGDVRFLFHEGDLGTAGNSLLLDALATDEQLQIGDDDYSFDVWFVGNTSSGNYMKWDLDGGTDSLGALVFNNADIDIGSSDLIRFGDSQEFTLGMTSADTLVLTGHSKTFTFGSDGNGMDVYWYSEDASKYVYFDEDNKEVYFKDLDIQLDDNAELHIGSGDDWVISGTSTLIFLPAANNSMITIGNAGGTYCSDLSWYTDTAAAGIFIDSSADKIYVDKVDFHIGTDDYICFGDDAVAGATAPTGVTLRYNSSLAALEIYGDINLPSHDISCTDLTVAGTFSITGDYSPGSVSLGDDEEFILGDDSDFVIKYESADTALYINGAAANDEIRIGNSTATDVYFHGATYDTWFDASSEGFILNDSAKLIFGSGTDYWITTAGSTGDLIIAGANANDQVSVGDGVTGIDFVVENQTNSGANFWFDHSTQTVFFGIDNKGLDVKFFVEAASDYSLLDQSENSWINEDVAITMQDSTEIRFGDGSSAAGGDFKLYSDGTGMYLQEVSAAGKVLHLGESGKGLDVTFYGDDAGYDMLWDQSADGLLLKDNANLFIGATAANPDLTIMSDGTSTAFVLGVHTKFTGEGFNIQFGLSGTNGSDIVFQTAGASGKNMTFDAGASTFTMTDVQLIMSATAADCSYYIFPESTSTSLNIMATDTSVAKIWFGTSGTNGLDIQFDTAGASGKMMYFNAGASTFTMTDVQLCMSATAADCTYYIFPESGSTALNIMATDTSVAKVWFGTSGTNGLDILIDTASASGHQMLFDAGASTFTITDVQLIMSATAATNKYYIYPESGSTFMYIYGTDNANTKLQFGLSGTNGMDIVFQTAGASGKNMTFDAGASTFTMTDVQLIMSATAATNKYYIYPESGSTFMYIYGTETSANTKLQFGLSGSHGMDIIFQTAGASGKNMTFDAGASTFTMTDVQLIMSSTTADCLYYIFPESTSTSLNIMATDTSVAKVWFGTSGTNGLDVQFDTAGASGKQMYFDAGASTFTMTDVQLVMSATAADCSYYIFPESTSTTLNIMATDTSVAKVWFGTSGTNGLDILFDTASASGHQMLFDAGASTFTMTDVKLIMSATAATVAYNLYPASGSTFFYINATDNAAAKLIIGTSGTNNGLDVTLVTASGDGNIVWDAGAKTFTCGSGVSVVCNGTSGVYESGLVVPLLTNSATVVAPTVGSLVFDEKSCTFQIFTNSGWVKTSAAYVAQ